MTRGRALQLYVFLPRGIGRDAARARMSRSLRDLATMYAAAYGLIYVERVEIVGSVVIGSLGHASATVHGWDGGAWSGTLETGMAVAGVIGSDPGASEDSPGVQQSEVRSALADSARRGGHEAVLRRAVALPGRWCAAAWDPDKVVVLNGLATGLSMWRTDGPDGWAVGNRAGPLLELTGQAPKISVEAAAMIAAFGYVAGSRHLFDGVSRFWPGERAVFGASREPMIDRPMGLGEFLGPRRDLAYEEVVTGIADRATALVADAALRSIRPSLALSGGRDSRLLAAAAVRAGYPLPVHTSGPASSPDVVIARDVARALGLDHHAAADLKPGDSLEQLERRKAGGGGRGLPMTLDRLAAWVRVNEGTAPISLARIAGDLSIEHAAVAAPPRELVNGLGGETHRGTYYPDAADIDTPGTARGGPDLVVRRFGSSPILRPPVGEILSAEIGAAQDDLTDLSLPLSEWLSRFHLRFRENCRGSDTQARADLVTWVWAPLMDAGFLGLSREAPASTKVNSRLIEDATVFLAPELADIPYDRQPPTRRPERAHAAPQRSALRDVARGVRRRLFGHPAPKAMTDQFTPIWQELFFDNGGRIWPALIRRTDLERLVRTQPDARTLMEIAGVELFARVHDLGD